MITEEQRILRQNSIGGSDIGVLLGLSTFKTPYQLYLEKKGLLLPAIENDYQYWGNALEPLIRSEFEKRNLVKIQTVPTQEHPLFPFLRGNLDGWIPEWNAVFEAKSASAFFRDEWGELKTDEIPITYKAQVAFYCAIMNCSTAHISVLIGGNDYREYVYERNHNIERHIINSACNFWDAVQNNTPPEPVNIEDVRLLFPESTPKKLKRVNPETERLIQDLTHTKEQIKELQKFEESAKFELMKLMEDAEFLDNEEGRNLVSWKTNKKGSRSFILKGNNKDANK